MAWADNLQNASFRGLAFDVTATSEQVSRDHAEYEYPNVDGADLQDMGRKARPFRLTAFLWGDTYEYHLQRLIAVLDKSGAGELIHPVYGSIPSAIVTGYEIKHDAENPNSCTVELSFLESGTGTTLFATPLPEMFGSALFEELDKLVAELADFFAAIMAPLNTINSLIKRAKTIESALINTLLTFKSDVSYTADQLADLASAPAEFIYELSNVLEIHTANIASAVPVLAQAALVTTFGMAQSAPVAATSSTLLSSFNEVVSDMDALVVLPEAFITGDVTPEVAMPSGSSLADVQDVVAVYSVSAAIELASATTAIFADDAQSAVLTPDDIERLVNDVRVRSQSSISRLRSRYEPARAHITETSTPVGIMWLDVVSGLQSAALGVQSLGLLVLSRRPPLTRKRIASDTCLRLLAHQWYSDHNRAAELLRLNPQVRDPNLITAGMVINAYAK